MPFFAALAQQAPAAQPSGPGGAAMGLMPILLMVGVMYFLVLRPQSKKTKELQAMLSQLKVGDRVWTQAGFSGRITGIKDTEITVEVSQGVRLKMRRSAITERDVGESKASESKAS